MTIKFKVGDRVKVITKVETEDGWNNSWVSDMDGFIDHSFIIKEIDNNFGYVLDSKSFLDYVDVDYYFPASSIKIEE